MLTLYTSLWRTVACNVSLLLRLIDYGLRDYGTARWEGGDPECDHNPQRPDGGDRADRSLPLGRGGMYRQVCGKCGAVRVDNQIGLEQTPDEYVSNLVAVFREVKRVLREDGTCWCNLGDSYSGSGKGDNPNGKQGTNTGTRFDSPTSGSVPSGLKPKDLIGIPWRVAFALQADGWYLRSDIIWAKNNPMPESVTDRATKSHEYIFMLTKSPRYYFDQNAVREPLQDSTIQRNNYGWDGNGQGVYSIGRKREPGDFGDPVAGRNIRTVWTIATQPTSDWGESARLHRVSGDAPCGDKRRITSQDCPVHGGRLVRLANNLYGELLDDGLIRNVHTYDGLSQVPSSGLPATHESDVLEAPNCERLRRICSLSAIDHSNGKNKTGRALETNQPCNSCAEIVYHIGDRLKLHELSEQHPGIYDCNTLLDEQRVHLLDRIPFGNTGKFSFSVPPSCTCSFYTITTERSSHFATFPEKLVEPCIKAGTSEKGCCPKCGKPWGRVTKVEGETNRQKAERVGGFSAKNPVNQGINCKGGHGDGSNRIVSTTGWQPACNCDAGDPVPCVVFDPFAGSGTVERVAIRLRRKSVGTELNYQYIRDIVSKRTADIQPTLV